MKFENSIPVTEIAELIGANKIIGDSSILATGINEIHKVTPGDIMFSDVPKYFQKSLESAASIIILNEEVECPEGKVILIHDEPFQAYNKLVLRFRPFRYLNQNIHPEAQIHPSTIIEPNVVIGHNVVIGKNCHIQANAVIYADVIIGDNVVIQSCSVVGSDAFYLKKTPEKYHVWNSCGRVIIEDDVLVGAACTINKGVSGDTVIGKGTKFDSQIHIGHGAVIGKNCLFAAQVGIGGKTIVEDGVVLYGQVGVAQNLLIGENAVVLAKSGVSRNLDSNKVYFGYPASEARENYKEIAALKNLPSFMSVMNKHLKSFLDNENMEE